MSKIFFIQANIGVGKTTLCQMIKKFHPKIEVFLEPSCVWEKLKDSNGKSIIQHFYENPKKNAYLFQSMAFIDRFIDLEKIDLKSGKTYIFERSPESDREIFAKTCYETGLMEEIEWVVYNKWFNQLKSKINFPSKNIYLRCSPETCLKRISERDRNGESNITIDYLTQLHKCHEKWLNPDTNNIVVNGELNFRDDKKIFDCIMQEILKD